MGKFLDLLDQSNKNSPNENYGRELIQLFMMGEYLPGESKELGSPRNYEESGHNTSTGVVFLSGSLKPGVSFPFVNGSGALDLGTMPTPIGGNNGLADNTIDYIF